MPTDTDEETRGASTQIDAFTSDGFGYFLEQATRPQTIGYALLDSPVALAAWMLDHDTDSYFEDLPRVRRRAAVGQPHARPILDNITLYWLTGTGASAARVVLGERTGPSQAAGQAPPPMTLPFGFTTFPGEIWRTPRSWAEKAYPNVDLLQRSRRAATSPRGRSRSCSPKSCGPRSGRCADERPTLQKAIG